VAVTLGMGSLSARLNLLPCAQLRSEERLAAIGAGRNPCRAGVVPGGAFPQVGHPARQRPTRYIATFGLIAGIQADRDIWTARAFGIIPLAVGLVISWIGR